MTIDAPLNLVRETIRSEWTDYNGHMNMAWFVHLFDQAAHAFYPVIGLGETYRERTDRTTFAADGRITFSREGNVGEELVVTAQLLDHDDKRIHYFEVLRHAGKGYQLATMELMALHVDLKTRKVTPMPEEVMALLADLQKAHAALPMPPEVGRPIGIRRK